MHEETVDILLKIIVVISGIYMREGNFGIRTSFYWRAVVLA
jgi:hypothetical protein